MHASDLSSLVGFLKGHMLWNQPPGQEQVTSTHFEVPPSVTDPMGTTFLTLLLSLTLHRVYRTALRGWLLIYSDTSRHVKPKAGAGAGGQGPGSEGAGGCSPEGVCREQSE